MENVKMETKGNILTITVDLSQEHGLSKSGKSYSIASTLGSRAVPGHDSAKIGLNVYRPAR